METCGPLVFLFNLVAHGDAKGFDHVLAGVRLRLPSPIPGVPHSVWGLGAGVPLPRFLWPRVAGSSSALPSAGGSEGWYASITVRTPPLLAPFLGDLVVAYSGAITRIEGDWRRNSHH